VKRGGEGACGVFVRVLRSVCRVTACAYAWPGVCHASALACVSRVQSQHSVCARAGACHLPFSTVHIRCCAWLAAFMAVPPQAPHTRTTSPKERPGCYGNAPLMGSHRERSRCGLALLCNWRLVATRALASRAASAAAASGGRGGCLRLLLVPARQMYTAHRVNKYRRA
jgi:hypothetical protein